MKPEKAMREIEFVQLADIEEEWLVALMNNDKVGRLMPLLTGRFSVENCRAFLKAKKQMWEQYGFGPWGILINGAFAGWGGLQPEQGEADFALVLHPDYWGWGRKIFTRVKEYAFHQKGLDSITILFPPNRTNAKAIFRMGFTEDGSTMINGECFRRFRLNKV